MPAITQPLEILKTSIELLSRHPGILHETLFSLRRYDKRIFLEVLDATDHFHVLNELELSALVMLIKEVFDHSWLLSARIIERLRPGIRHAVAAQLSEDTRNNILKVLRIWQKFGELEFMLDGEYIPDGYIMTGEWPELFPERLRKECALCGKGYKNFDGIEVVDEDVQSSCHEGRMCSESLSGLEHDQSDRD
ncbi:hypothetical protein K469DRAFT_690738 [Zopfia rhizophila CBS 207.26]|uniref:Uncharacterized protein n=1 Tax=Zopfia rhizophila CBS 207.26 TaxID=1314779 RepID=A0A6A6DSQ4_9PEZI|nr:hypothetical protein K469DRAFT_690738 [Zopfia rhizophila CBS 207.26]